MDIEMKNEILAAIENVNKKVDEIQKEVAKIPKIEKEVAKIPEMQEDIAELKTDVAALQIDVSELKNKTLEMEKDISEFKDQSSKIQIDIRSISRSVAVIEQEHGDKLKALFDAFTTNTEAIEKQNNKISFCKQKIENHDIEIDTLKTRVQGL